MLNGEHDLHNTYPCEVLLSRKVEKTRTTYQWMLNGEHDLPNIYPCEVMLSRKAEKQQLLINVGEH